jgi:hypothetical protein
MRMLLLLKMMDQGALAKLTALLLDVILLVPLPMFSVRACHHGLVKQLPY